MAKTNLDTFSDLIRPFVKGCPEEAIEESVRRACITLCEQSLVIRSNIAAGDVVAGSDDYTITSDTDTQPITVISLLYNGVELYPKTEEELDIIDSGWRTSDPGPATWFMGLAPDRIKLNRVPDTTITGGLVPRVATRPTETAVQVDIRLFNEWAQAIKHGAISELMEIPEKAWSDTKMSIWHGQRFNNEIQRARSAADKGYQRKSTTVKLRAWI